MVKALSVARTELAAHSVPLADFQLTHFMLEVLGKSRTVSERVLDRILVHVEVGHFGA